MSSVTEVDKILLSVTGTALMTFEMVSYYSIRSIPWGWRIGIFTGSLLISYLCTVKGLPSRVTQKFGVNFKLLFDCR